MHKVKSSLYRLKISWCRRLTSMGAAPDFHVAHGFANGLALYRWHAVNYPGRDNRT